MLLFNNKLHNWKRIYMTDSDSKSMRTVDCDCCDSVFSISKSYYYYYGDDIHMCPSCKTDHRGLMDDTIDEAKIRPGLRLRVKYDIHKRGHSGYCSGADPDSYFEKDDTETMDFPVLRRIRDYHHSHGKVHDEQILRLYTPDPEYVCQCCCQSTYTVKSAKIIKSVDEIHRSDSDDDSESGDDSD